MDATRMPASYIHPRQHIFSSRHINTLVTEDTYLQRDISEKSVFDLPEMCLLSLHGGDEGKNRENRAAARRLSVG